MGVVVNVDETGAVSGTVTDANGDPIRSARLSVSGDVFTDQYLSNPHPGVITGSAGEFSFYAAPGSYTVSVDIEVTETPSLPEPATVEVPDSPHLAAVVGTPIGTEGSPASVSVPGQDTSSTGAEAVGAPEPAATETPAEAPPAEPVAATTETPAAPAETWPEPAPEVAANPTIGEPPA